MGKLAPLDCTPFKVAAACQAQLLFTFGFKSKPGYYDFYAEPARTYCYSPDKDRRLSALEWTQEFAEALERRLVDYPDQWFNFFPFWSSQPTALGTGAGAGAASSRNVAIEDLLQKSPMSVPAPTSIPTPGISGNLAGIQGVNPGIELDPGFRLSRVMRATE